MEEAIDFPAWQRLLARLRELKEEPGETRVHLDMRDVDLILAVGGVCYIPARVAVDIPSYPVTTNALTTNYDFWTPELAKTILEDVKSG